MVELKKLIELKQKGKLQFLEPERRRTSVATKILSLLKTEALPVDEIAKRLGIAKTTAYNSCRRYERKNLIVAFSANNNVVFLEKKKAQEEGLI